MESESCNKYYNYKNYKIIIKLLINNNFTNFY